MIFAGTLREELTFYRVVEVQSASGHKSTQEQFMFTCKAFRKRNKENYTVDAGEIYHTNELTFQLRTRAIDETNIVVYNGERYRITSLNKDPREGDMTIIVAKINE